MCLDNNYLDVVKKLNNINILGLMGMATFTDDKELINTEFKELENLFKKMKTIEKEKIFFSVVHFSC